MQTLYKKSFLWYNNLEIFRLASEREKRADNDLPKQKEQEIWIIEKNMKIG